MEIIVGIISLLMIIIFFVMANDISHMRSEIKNINLIFTAWTKANGGYGITYICNKCKKSFEGQPEKCPHCGELLAFKK